MEEPFELRRGPYLVSTDTSRIDVGLVHSWLTKSYWARGISLEIVQRSIRSAISLGVYRDGGQVAFARIITDCATFAYLADVYVTETERGRGVGKFLVQASLTHPHVQGLRRWMLGTLDAHGLYEQFGFRNLSSPERWMEIHAPYDIGAGP